MFGLILIYIIWKQFSQLAAKHRRSKWGYTLAGIAAYYAGTIVSAIVIGMICALISPDLVDEPGVFGLLSIPIGCVCVWALHRYLSKKWDNDLPKPKEQALDTEMF